MLVHSVKSVEALLTTLLFKNWTPSNRTIPQWFALDGTRNLFTEGSVTLRSEDELVQLNAKHSPNIKYNNTPNNG